MTLSKNDYLKKGNNYQRVIEVLGEIVFPSYTFSKYNDEFSDGRAIRDVVNRPMTITELYAEGWTPCTAQEAGAPEEKWRPTDREEYFYAEFDGMKIRSDFTTWDGLYVDDQHLAIGNVHKTPDEAIAWLKSKLDLKV